MELKGSKTEANLLAAFTDKAHAKNMYDSYAYRYAYSGHQHIQNTMYDSAKVEGAHAKILYEFLYGPVTNTQANVKTMLDDEINTGKEMRECAHIAKEEGFAEAAFFFEETAKIHDDHIKTYRKILLNLENNKVFTKDEKVDWVCVACGYAVHDNSPNETCPYCEHPKGLFYINPTNF